MDYFRLTAGLLIPWLAGTFWIRTIDHYAGRRSGSNPLRQSGYGLFLGLAGLYLLIVVQSHLFGWVKFWPTIATLCLLAALGWVQCRKMSSALPGGVAVEHNHNWPISGLLLCLIALHLVISWGEILNLPVYPWDAWLVWVFRAKAWYYSGYLAPIASHQEWLNGSQHYAMAASGYPGFASVMPFWAAISLGRWSETLVNAPVILCGLGLVIGLYGSCREYGLGLAASLVAAYLLLSIPMIGTHLSLGGYADIWMTGFVGLGAIALLQGLMRRDGAAITLGLAFIAFSTQVKLEGTVWFYLALATLVISTVRGHYLVALSVALTLLGLLALVTGSAAISLPGLGKVGFDNGLVHLPMIVPIALKHYPLLEPYQTAIFEHGSWQLMGVLLALSIAVLLATGDRKANRAPLAFLACLIASQVFIFGFTEMGRWATSYTAINRLPMHFSPALVFVTMLALSKFHWRPTRRWLSATTATLALAAIIAGTAQQLMPMGETDATAPVSLAGKQLRAVMGKGQADGDSLRITGFQDGFAIVSAGSSRLIAQDYNHLQLNLATDGSRSPSFFWRLASDPADLNFLDVDSDDSTIDLSHQRGWEGIVTEFGVAFYEPGATQSSVQRITLSQATLATNAAALLDSWMTTLPWTQQSINWAKLGQERQHIHLVTVISAWLALAVLLMGCLWLVPALRQSAFSAVPLILGVAWLVLDLQWLNVRGDRLHQTLATARLPGPPYILEGADKQMAELASQVKTAGLAPGSRVAILAQDGATAFETLRMNYHLLPLSAMPLNPARWAEAAPGVEASILLTNPRQPDAGWLTQLAEKMTESSPLSEHSELASRYGKLLVAADDH